MMKPEEGNDSLDTTGKDDFFSYFKLDDSSVQCIQLLLALKQTGDLPVWPLSTPSKVQMQQCDRCPRQFCSTINYKRHKRLNHWNLDKDSIISTINREELGAFWDKLSEDEAKEILSLKDVVMEGVQGSSIMESLQTLIQEQGFSSLPHYCLKAGSTLLDIIQARPSPFPLSSEQLFTILDDASEMTFLCGSVISVQNYIFSREAAEFVLETKNLVAFTSLLVEQKLFKAWSTEKHVECMKLQNLIMEEEETTQRRQAEDLERRRQKKRRQKAKEQNRDKKADVMENIDERLACVPPSEQSCTLAASDSDMLGPETLPDDALSSPEPFQPPNTDQDMDLEIHTGSGNGYTDLGTGHNIKKWSIVQGKSRRHKVDQRNMSPKSHYLAHSQKSQAPKLSITNWGDSKPVPIVSGHQKWIRKPEPKHNVDSLKTIAQKEATSQANFCKEEVPFGCIPVTVSNKPSTMLFGPSTEASEDDRINGGKTEDQTLSSDSCLKSCTTGENFGGMGNTSQLKESSHPAISLQMPIQKAKDLLQARWEKVMAGKHLELVVSPDISEDIKEQNIPCDAENQLVDGLQLLELVRPVLQQSQRTEKGTQLKHTAEGRANTY